MNAVERLEAAIAKLEALKADSTPGLWAWAGDFLSDRVGLYADDIGPVITAYGEHTQGYLEVAPADAELIVTLHRSIDAQLAILRSGKWAVVHEYVPGLKYALDAQALADAVLGGAS